MILLISLNTSSGNTFLSKISHILNMALLETYLHYEPNTIAHKEIQTAVKEFQRGLFLRFGGHSVSIRHGSLRTYSVRQLHVTVQSDAAMGDAWNRRPLCGLCTFSRRELCMSPLFLEDRVLRNFVLCGSICEIF